MDDVIVNLTKEIMSLKQQLAAKEEEIGKLKSLNYCIACISVLNANKDLKSQLCTMRAALESADNTLDFHAEKGLILCRWCSSRTYGGNGIEHHAKCVLTIIRQALSNVGPCEHEE